MVERDVVRDEVVGKAGTHRPGKGTYVEGDAVRAYFDGTLMVDDEGVCTVTRPRRSLPNARRRKGEHAPEDAGAEASARGAVAGAGHRHGAGKHGRPRGKPKKGRGDQGTWD